MLVIQILARILLPFISGILYRLGGDAEAPLIFGHNIWRNIIGIPIAIVFCIINKSLIPLLCIPIYCWLQPPYGGNSWLNFLGSWGKWAVCGFVFGVSSIPALGWFWGLVQGFISMVAFLVIKWFDDRHIINNPWTERARGFFGTLIT